jgi:hypothetical protein
MGFAARIGNGNIWKRLLPGCLQRRLSPPATSLQRLENLIVDIDDAITLAERTEI